VLDISSLIVPSPPAGVAIVAGPPGPASTVPGPASTVPGPPGPASVAYDTDGVPYLLV